MSKILDGKIIRDEIIIKLKKEIEGLKTKPILAIIQIGDLAESNKYIKAKKSFDEKIGAEVQHLKFANDILQTEIVLEIQRLNQDQTITGIIVQLPLPKHLLVNEIINAIDPRKDVDGLTENSPFTPATAKGILTMLNYYKINPTGKKVTVMGRSKLVGQPIAKALTGLGAEVSVVHSKTENPKEITRSADILIVAIGKTNLVDDSYLKKDQIVIDVGINLDGDRLVGDVNFDKVKGLVSAITPVPGGVGPLTVASLFENLVEAYKRQYN
ncbi:MAG: bifunctional 5,10-methylenetetrahydrofolate dehydrogenase/5,10-methenyltetrahydrofolate cyclohydrolase [Candidatus Paceibacterota bacterium]